MKILSNDYASSIPDSSAQIKGGPARFAADFSQFVIEQGHRWIGFIHDATRPEPGHTLALETASKLLLILHLPAAAGERVRELTGISDPEKQFALEIDLATKLMEQQRPDIVFLNGFSVFVWILSVAARRCHTPVVIQHAGIMAKEVDIYRDLFTLESAQLCDQLEQQAAEEAAMNVFLNEFSQDAFRDIHGPGAVARAGVIPLPHAGWPFATDYGPRAQTERIIGIIARWDRIKNHEAVAGFAEGVAAAGLPWQIKAITAIPNTPLHADFKKRYRELIEVLPNTDREGILKFCRSCDAMILPSHFDVSPTTVMEALAAGTPTVISPNVGWVTEYRRHGLSEWISDFKEPTAVVALLKKQFARPDWPELAPFAKHIETCHSKDTVYQSYLGLFARLSHN